MPLNNSEKAEIKKFAEAWHSVVEHNITQALANTNLAPTDDSYKSILNKLLSIFHFATDGEIIKGDDDNDGFSQYNLYVLKPLEDELSHDVDHDNFSGTILNLSDFIFDISHSANFPLNDKETYKESLSPKKLLEKLQPEISIDEVTKSIRDNFRECLKKSQKEHYKLSYEQNVSGLSFTQAFDNETSNFLTKCVKVPALAA